MYLGKTKVEGQGIKITINDVDKQSSDEEDTVNPISAEDLMVIVDYLKLAGAEAISINEERILNMTDIVDVGSNFLIFVNQQRILAPYEIKAIGDQTKLESTLLGNGGYVEELRNYGFKITIEKTKVTIPKYSKDIGHKYIQEKEKEMMNYDYFSYDNNMYIRSSCRIKCSNDIIYIFKLFGNCNNSSIRLCIWRSCISN